MGQQYRVLLFTDQVGSTRQATQSTPEQLRRVAEEQTALTARAVSTCGGDILKDTGDGHLISFTTPASAVRCGWLIQSLVRDRSLCSPGTQLDFELHIGIDAGLVEVLPNEDVRGDAANRAARICSECPGGQVYCSVTVRGDVRADDAEFDLVGEVDPRRTAGAVPLYRVTRWLGQPVPLENPFIWRSGVGDPQAFVGRAREIRTLQSYLRGRQSCQVLGPRRIGKTSLLRRLESTVAETLPGARPVYLTAQDPRLRTQAGLLSYVLSRLGFDCAGDESQSALLTAVDTLVAANERPILLLDEFEEALSRTTEYDRDFLLTLRACAERGMSLITSTRRPLRELTDPSDSTSPFFNVFARLDVGLLKPAEATDFVRRYRLGVPPFSEEERAAILTFANGHPLALQVAAYHVLETRVSEVSLELALEDAFRELSTALPGWPRWDG